MLFKDASKTKNNQELVKASIDALVKALVTGHSEALSAYLTAMSQFHNYSFQNILLIASQRPTASRVAGIRSWNELGRRVKRGESGDEMNLVPFYWRNDYVVIEQYSAFTEDGKTLLNANLRREHIAFAGTWDTGLRAQGFLEAFVKQQKGDT